MVLSRDFSDYKRGFELTTGFTGHLQLVNTSQNYVLTVLQTSQLAIGHTMYSQSVTVFTSRCSVAVSNGGPSTLYGLPNGSRPSYRLLDCTVAIPSVTHRSILMIGLCILLRVYQSIYIETSVRNKCRCSFYCARLILHVSSPIGGQLRVVFVTQKKFEGCYCMSTDPLLQYVNM
jgi:hypothetical protein